MSTAASQKYLDPKMLTKLASLEMKARLIVEGYISGLHKSPYHGFSVEFAQHREYVPGDDLKHLDWRVYAKSDRYYLKEYEEETNLRAYVLLDVSESMKYGSGRISKLEYGCYIAASLAYLIIRQQDACGLVLFDREIQRYRRPSSSPAQLRDLLAIMAEIVPQERTDMSLIFHDLAERIHRRGMIIIISDLFDDPDKVLFGLQHFRHKRHEVIVFHVLDDYELTFPFTDLTLFEGLEKWPQLLVDPRQLQLAYLEALNDFVTRIKRGCRNNKIDYVPVNTKTPLDVVLSAYLTTRMSTRAK